MLSVEDARGRILQAVRPVGAETVALAQGFGRVLAADVLARLTHPPADVSAMDGYAVRAADAVAGAVLRLVGAAPAGHPFAGIVGAGETVRLFTGSFVPAGADAILLQEHAAADGAAITVGQSCTAGKHIRPAGQDFAAGDVLLPAGRRLAARDIGLAAAGNHPWLSVFRRPRIALLATGDEVVLPGEALPPGGIISSNTHALAAFITAAGAEPLVLPIAGDSLGAIAAGIAAARGADMLLTAGGASVGDHDLVQSALKAQGMTLDFWRIAMRPGKPLMFGMLADMPVLGLPGNPVSAFVCAMLFLRPAIERMSGLSAGAPALGQAVLGAAMKENDQREDYVRARLTAPGVVTPFPVQDSGMLRTLAQSDALIRRLPFAPASPEGTAVEVIWLNET